MGLKRSGLRMRNVGRGRCRGNGPRERKSGWRIMIRSRLGLWAVSWMVKVVLIKHSITGDIHSACRNVKTQVAVVKGAVA